MPRSRSAAAGFPCCPAVLEQGGERQVDLPLPLADQGHFFDFDRLNRVAQHREQRFQLLQQEQPFGVVAGALQRLHQIPQTLGLGTTLLHDRGGLTLGIGDHRQRFGFRRCDHIGFELLHHLLDAFLLHGHFGLGTS